MPSARPVAGLVRLESRPASRRSIPTVRGVGARTGAGAGFLGATVVFFWGGGAIGEQLRHVDRVPLDDDGDADLVVGLVDDDGLV